MPTIDKIFPDKHAFMCDNLASWLKRGRLHADVYPNARISHSHFVWSTATIYIPPCSPETHQITVTSDILPTTCCPDCIHVTDTCLKEGEHWQEIFSKGAHRRRSASLDLSAGPSGSEGNNINPRERAASFQTTITLCRLNLVRDIPLECFRSL